MPQANVIQTAFTAGVINPWLAMRVDLKQYYEGLKQGDDILPLVQGGFRRRPGLKYIGTAAGDGRLESFSFNTEQSYLFAFSNQRIDIYKDGSLVKSLTLGDGAVWTSAQIPDLGIAQSADTMIVCHEDQQPRKIVRGATDVDWTISTLTLHNIPFFDFDDSLSATPTDEVHDLDFSASGWTAGDSFSLVVNSTETARIFWSADEDLLKERVQYAVVNALLGIKLRSAGPVPGIGEDDREERRYWRARQAVLQRYKGRDTTVDGTYPNLEITFAAGDVWEGLKEITVVDTDISGAGTVTCTLDTAGSTRAEDVWSATRGWPKYPIFFEGRLWFGGSKSRPTAIFGSVTNDYFNFDLGDGLDDEAIFAVLDTDQVNAITGLAAGPRLQVFTTGGEHVANKGPLTPANISFPQHTKHGARALKPLSLEGPTVFVQRKGKQVRELRYEYLQDAHIAPSLSKLAPQLFNDPKAMAALQGTTTDDASYLYIVNGDGTVAVLLSQQDDDIAAWAKWTTDGSFKSVAVVEDSVYFLVSRTISGGTAYYIEEASLDYYLDSASQVTLSPAGVVVSGLWHLEGETVRVRADSAVRANETVSSGAITLDRDATDVEVGLWFQPLAESMPPHPDFGGGSTMADEKRITEASVYVYETLGLVVNGDRLPDRVLDVDKLDTMPEPYTGFKKHRPGDSRWEILPTLTLSQEDPLPMTVLGVVYEVEV